MKMIEIKDMTNEEIENKIIELKKQLLDLRFQLATGTLNETGEIKNTKKDVARLMTALNQK
jgi:large subunit ribosomal protein L29